MKGIVFVKFNEFIEELWGDEFWEHMLDEAPLESEGAYTSVGNYADQELVELILVAMKHKGLTMVQAQNAFGEWLFKELYSMAPPDAHDFKDTFEFLHGVQNVIHVEVKKLNPDAILPEFTFLEESENHLSMVYESPRHLCYFCEGLIKGLAQHTGESVSTSQSECVHEGGQRCVIEVNRQT